MVSVLVVVVVVVVMLVLVLVSVDARSAVANRDAGAGRVGRWCAGRRDRGSEPEIRGVGVRQRGIHMCRGGERARAEPAARRYAQITAGRVHATPPRATSQPHDLPRTGSPATAVGHFVF